VDLMQRAKNGGFEGRPTATLRPRLGRRGLMAAMLLLTHLTTVLSAGSLRGVVSFELDGVLWDSALVRAGCRTELQDFLKSRLSVSTLSSYEPLDVYDEMDALRKQGAENGFMLPGIQTVQVEALRLAISGSGLTEEEQKAIASDALVQWLRSHDAYAGLVLEEAAVPALQELRARGFRCCAITNSIGNSKRLSSLDPHMDFTLNTYDFTVGAEEAWDVAFQVAPAKFLGQGAPEGAWVHVCGKVEGSLALAAQRGLKTVALCDAKDVLSLATGGVNPTARVSLLSELPDLIDGMFS